jgi:hypothetical protein
MAYTYDPSQSIQQGFQQAKMDVGNIFAQVIQQQQRDYTLAENAFQNIEALKKDLNIFGQKNVTEKSNALLKEAGSAILANGKLDYSKLGEIRQKVSDIKDLKQGYELGSKEYERMLQLGIANKDNMVSFEKFYKDLSSKMGDENLVKNPQDLQRALADTYSNNLDASAMFGKTFLKQNPLQPVSQDIRNAKGQVVGTATGQLPAGWSVGADGKKIPPPSVTVTGADGQPRTLDYIDQQLQNVQQNNPDMWALMKKQTGFAGTIMNDRDIMQNYLSKIPMTLNTRESKSANQLRMEELTLKSAERKDIVEPTLINLDIQGKRTSIEASKAAIKNSNATADLTQAKIDALNTQSNPQNLTANGVMKDDNGNITVNYGKNVFLNSAQVYNPQTKLLEEKPFVVVNRKILKDGSQQLIGFVPPAGMSKIEAIQASFAPKDLISTPLTKANYTNFNSVFVSKPFNKEFARRNSIAENLASENISDTKQPTPPANPTPAPPKPAPSPTPKPAASKKIQVTVAQVQAQAKAQKYDYNEYKTYLENNGYIVNQK